MSIAAAAVSILATAGQSTGMGCTALPGWESAIAVTDIRWIVIGEFHGNNESPQIFADVVCLTSRSRRVIAAVEQPAEDQPAIDSFIASDGGKAAQRAFLRATMWNYPLKDGRSSRAYFRLFETLRTMRRAGAISAVIAFQPTAADFRDQPIPPGPAVSEEAMARRLREAASPGITVVALVGNVHAMRTEVKFRGGYVPMAGRLPLEQSLTFNIAGRSGSSWACMGQPMSCGSQPYSSPEVDRQRGVAMAADKSAAYSGTIVLGTPLTASLPQTVGE